MGAVCISKEQRLQNEKIKRECLQKARQHEYAKQNSIYTQKVKKYRQFYGRPITSETKQFIQNNFNPNYSSELRTAGYPRYGQLFLTYKSSIIDRFEAAHKNGNNMSSLEIVDIDQSRQKLIWKVQIRSNQKTRYYDCITCFDSQDRFYSAIWNEQEKYTAPVYYPPAPVESPVNTGYQNSSSNNYYGKPYDWNAHYNAEVARSNEQFRQNMNKQAQEWNNYATQKNNRGW